MDELEYVRGFRAAVPAGERDRARTALLDAIAAAEAPVWKRRRLRLGLVLAVVAITGVVVGSALGVGDRILELIAGKPAPPSIAARLKDEALAKRITPLFADNPDVRTQDAHGVVAIGTSGGPVALWTVPTSGGTICYFVEFVRLSERDGSPQGESRCVPGPSPGAPILWTNAKRRVDGREVHVLAGPIDPVVGSVWLRSPDGADIRATQADGFYLVAFPDERQGYELIARDTAGREFKPVPLMGVIPGVFDRQSERKVAGPPRTVIETTDSRGRPLRLLLQPVEHGETCLIVGGGTTCPPADKLRTPTGIAVYPTLEGSIVYLSGSVGPEVSQLTLRYEDGQEVELPVVERFVLYDIPRAHFNDGARPIELIGRNSEGVEVAQQKVDQDVFGPKSSIWLPGDVSP
jgi:hypothetical protein